MPLWLVALFFTVLAASELSNTSLNTSNATLNRFLFAKRLFISRCIVDSTSFRLILPEAGSTLLRILSYLSPPVLARLMGYIKRLLGDAFHRRSCFRMRMPL
ncbi:hypothetical protein AOQ84DRAFT_352666 [Glonium stellatum]|uniref:Secreted protein n=1 Tax=Glonium stellatum TaxID=574774 RepID=A0A8E2JWW6_9PEZI|nr:hypothetical protein AOQ84DRAFT_352666 [Glonium stellatum]